MDPAEFLTTWISNVGFPIAVAVYLLVRIEKRLQELTTTQQELINHIENVLELLKPK
jgi:hypothetical protein